MQLKHWKLLIKINLLKMLKPIYSSNPTGMMFILKSNLPGS